VVVLITQMTYQYRHALSHQRSAKATGQAVVCAGRESQSMIRRRLVDSHWEGGALAEVAVDLNRSA
jgi:hypothetical protein